MATSADWAVGPRSEYNEVDLHDLSPADLQRAIDLFRKVTDQRLEERIALHHRLNAAFLEGGVELVSPAAQRQALKSASLRSRLLEEGAWRPTSPLRRSATPPRAPPTRTWVARQRTAGRLVTVEVQGRTLIPAIQLTEDGALDRPVAQLVEPLVAAGLGSWGVWSWLTAPDGRLSGDVPVKIVHEEPERALRAAQRYARELETARTLA